MDDIVSREDQLLSAAREIFVGAHIYRWRMVVLWENVAIPVVG